MDCAIAELGEECVEKLLTSPLVLGDRNRVLTCSMSARESKPVLYARSLFHRSLTIKVVTEDVYDTACR